MLRNLTDRIKDINEALPCMFIVDSVYFLLGEMLIFILTKRPFFYGIGFLAGVIYSVFASVHMSLTIRKVVYGNTSPTKGYVLGYMIRLLVMLIIFTIIYVFNLGDLLFAVIGMFSMKVSAYLQPFTDKIIKKILKKGR